MEAAKRVLGECIEIAVTDITSGVVQAREVLRSELVSLGLSEVTAESRLSWMSTLTPGGVKYADTQSLERVRCIWVAQAPQIRYLFREVRDGIDASGQGTKIYIFQKETTFPKQAG